MNGRPLIKLHREKAGKTQADIASIVSGIADVPVGQSQVSRWEDVPDSIPPRFLRPLARALGVSVDELFEPPVDAREMSVDAGDPYAPLRLNIEVLKAWKEAAPEVPDAPSGTPLELEVARLCDVLRRKPNVALAGHFDAGKTRLCNALLGNDIFLARYTPTTALSTWIMHVSDRPPECTQQVYILRDIKDPSTLRSAAEFIEHTEFCGGLDTLLAHGTHQGGGAPEGDYVVVVFVDAPILRACNLVDLPGIDKDQSDTRHAGAGMHGVDALIYLSQATGFLGARDIAFLRQYTRRLPILDVEQRRPLANLFVVASHAHPNIRDEDLATILRVGGETLYRELSDIVLADRTARSGRAIAQADVASRMFSFWFERKDRCERFHEALKDVLSRGIPQTKCGEAHLAVEQFKNRAQAACLRLVGEYRGVIDDLDAATKSAASALQDEPRRRSETTKRHAEVRAAINEARTATKAYLYNRYRALMTVDALEAFVRGKYEANRKAALEHAPGALLDALQSSFESYTQGRAKELAPLIDGLLAEYEGDGAVGGPRRPDSPRVQIAFDARAAFLGGIAGAGTVGALGVWAATLGNLGGYIVVAKVAGLLASLGISVGGSAALVSFVFTVGGPAVFALAIGLVVAWGVTSLFGDSWERRLAKKLIEVFEKQGVLRAYVDAVDKYWNDTGTAFERGANEVEQQYLRKLSEVSQRLNPRITSRESLKRTMQGLELLRTYYSGLPWRYLSN